jgi:ribosomal protein S14
MNKIKIKKKKREGDGFRIHAQCTACGPEE